MTTKPSRDIIAEAVEGWLPADGLAYPTDRMADAALTALSEAGYVVERSPCVRPQGDKIEEDYQREIWVNALERQIDDVIFDAWNEGFGSTESAKRVMTAICPHLRTMAQEVRHHCNALLGALRATISDVKFGVPYNVSSSIKAAEEIYDSALKFFANLDERQPEPVAGSSPFDEISIDVSTGEHDAGLRAFANMPPVEIMENKSKRVALFESYLNEPVPTPMEPVSGSHPKEYDEYVPTHQDLAAKAPTTEQPEERGAENRTGAQENGATRTRRNGESRTCAESGHTATQDNGQPVGLSYCAFCNSQHHESYRHCKEFTLESALDYLRAHNDGVYKITASKNCDALVVWLLDYLQRSPEVDPKV